VWLEQTVRHFCFNVLYNFTMGERPDSLKALHVAVIEKYKRNASARCNLEKVCPVVLFTYMTGKLNSEHLSEDKYTRY
jgi:hypothetical protein